MADLLVGLRAGTYTCAAAGTVLFYDILLTTTDEMRFIWPSQFSLPKSLYIVNRYLPIPCLLLGMYHLAGFRGEMSINLFVISRALLRPCTMANLVVQQLSLASATWLLVIRVMTLYAGNRFAVKGLYILFISTHLISILLCCIATHDVWDSTIYVSSLGICASGGTYLISVICITPVLCEIVLVVMQLVHAYRHTKQLGTILSPITPLMRTLYVDGFAYFVVVVTLRLWSTLMFLVADSSYWYLSTYLELSLVSITVSRLVIHLRKAAETHRSNPLGNCTSMPLSELDTNPTPDVDHGHGHAQDHSWDSRSYYSP